MSVTIPTFIPLVHAARKYNIPENVLTRLIQNGRIEAAQLPSGELLVSEDGLNEKTKEQIIDEKFAHLRGQGISIAEASREYDLPHPTIFRWVKKGYIRRLRREGNKVLIDVSEMAYCAEIYRLQDGRQGKRIFDRDGNPYRLKHPERTSI